MCLYLCVCQCVSVFLISSYGAPLAQRASYLALHSSLFGPDGAVSYDYILTNNNNSLLIGSKYIANGAHTIHFEPIWPMLQNLSKTLLCDLCLYLYVYISVCLCTCLCVSVCMLLFLYLFPDPGSIRIVTVI